MSTFTPNKSIEQPAHNAYIDTWDAPVNADWSIIDTALGSSVSLNATGLSGSQTLALNQYQPLTILVSGAPTAAITYVVPTGVGGHWIFRNGTTGGFNVGIASAAGGSTVLVPAGANTIVSCDGSSAGMRLAVNVPPAAAGSSTQLQYNSGGILAASSALTFDGTTFIAPNLYVPGNTQLGAGPGSTLELAGTTLTIPNGLTIGLGNLFVLNQTTNQVGIGTATLGAGNLLTVAGNIKITTGGLIFSDNTQLLSASSLGSSGASGAIQLSNGSSGFTSDSVFSYNVGTHTLSVSNLVVTGTVALMVPLPIAGGGTGAATAGAALLALGGAPLASPALTGVPTAPTASSGTAGTQLATVDYVNRVAGARYTSSSVAIPATNTSTNFAHSLGAVPFDWTAFIVCISTDGGYSTGTVIKFDQAAQQNTGINVSADATNVTVYMSSSGIFIPLPGSGGNSGPITAGNWNLVVKAWL